MAVTSVTSKGQVTIPKELRQRLGIRQGSRIEFLLVGDHVEMRVRSSPASEAGSGFGMLESRRKSVPTDFDPATVVKRVPQR
jgi:AbrB family looped-hinge helix DNA binding protein